MLPCCSMILFSMTSLALRIRTGSSLLSPSTTPITNVASRILTPNFVGSPNANKLRLFDTLHGHKSDANHDRDFWSNEAMLTVSQAWTFSLEELQKSGVSEPEWSVPHLLASALQLPWSNGFSQLQQAVLNNNNSELAERVLTPSEKELYHSYIKRRVDDEPLQYILGKWDFLDYEQLVVRAPLLCPRPETEELVELVRKDIQQHQQMREQQDVRRQISILEVGCGTGVIGIALADKLSLSKVTAIDIEPVAVATSIENARLVLGPEFSTRYSAKECSAADFSVLDITNDERFDVVVSNPPYIPTADMETLSRDVVEYESGQALFGGEDGMDVIRTIVKKFATDWGTKPSSVCWMEVNPTHPSLLKEWLDGDGQTKETLGVKLDSTYKDLSGNDRFVKLVFR